MLDREMDPGKVESWKMLEQDIQYWTDAIPEFLN